MCGKVRCILHGVSIFACTLREMGYYSGMSKHTEYTFESVIHPDPREDTIMANTESTARAKYLISISATTGETTTDEWSPELQEVLEAECEDSSTPGSGETRYDAWGTDRNGRQWRVERV